MPLAKIPGTNIQVFWNDKDALPMPRMAFDARPAGMSRVFEMPSRQTIKPKDNKPMTKRSNSYSGLREAVEASVIARLPKHLQKLALDEIKPVKQYRDTVRHDEDDARPYLSAEEIESRAATACEGMRDFDLGNLITAIMDRMADPTMVTGDRDFTPATKPTVAGDAPLNQPKLHGMDRMLKSEGRDDSTLNSSNRRYPRDAAPPAASTGDPSLDSFNNRFPGASSLRTVP